MVFVTVQHRITAAKMMCLTEEHDIVYRAPPSADGPQPTPPDARHSHDFSHRVQPSPVLLFRYSALTFNGHRIHYDDPFCKNSEGYDGLVVHGPLLATMMLDALRRARPTADISSFEFRAQAPVLDTQAFYAEGAFADEHTVHLWIRRDDGAEAMRGTATLR